MDIDQYEELLDELKMEGYVSFMYPDDARIAAADPCGECGGNDVYGEGMVKYSKTRAIETYRAFAICSHCGHVVEF